VRTTAAVVTQRLSETKKVRLDSVSADFDSGVFDSTNKVTLACAVRHDNIVQVDPIEGAGSGTINRSAAKAANRPYYSRLVGRGAQVKVTGFEVLRSLEIALSEEG